ncbi:MULTISPECIES: 2-C-methyl-D-erythritol 2,4-cyclodiphosphate synthase [unclassified Sphingopyxis]|uniref:2-C-methyl-D-erythritol 2,4-cyclodiphosphate synthase n=1 Tax=unclassified Sphingopyxis TaxID=2614943 RepID=UPI000736804B|nr:MULTISPECIES: 2-C-methyl-D-erythritol 2,4-cyclodiphosphate synthase [unclassified Sphingopyxis]KTE38249.1 2-C-methyl-D-erythritol 4-phosphate cytidylyltransferase [Sphingopyxis sp. HIX]KTE81930.1 2-C-methyl-D-erythritol 4-phosphate cytidylyltransferase [Sphingopyxis sp. HXXIV]
MDESAPLSGPPTIVIILLAGGRGARTGFAAPKQQAMLGGKPVLQWSLDALAAYPGVLVSADEIALPAGWKRAAPGAERQDSVARGLAALAGLDDDAVVLVHDSARPGVGRDVIARLIAAIAEGAAAAIPVLPVADTIVRQADADVVDRAELARVQTPQAFRLGALRRAHAEAAGAAASDDAQLVRRLGEPVALVAGDARLHKLTFAEDLAMLESLLGVEKETMRIATGMGYDVHRLVAGKPLWLGGIRIEHSHGLSGHSDADVALHAITDAVLGAAADGDIGSHFPPSDPQWKGAESWRFLDYAVQRVADRGGDIQHLDLTIVGEAPKVGPHREAMRLRISEIARLPLSRISVKATTTEGLGFAGRREGLAAQAVATILWKE